jgi:hypothetical protein
MADEIETTAQLIDLADLRDVVIHELAAIRLTGPDQYGVDLPSEELHAPDSPDDDVAMSLRASLEDRCLAVRCRIETCNAYGDFVVDGEAIFDLPAPVSARHSSIVDEFTEQVGVTAVFPYLRAAVASLAAQLCVPASPLPLLRSGAVTLEHDVESVVEDEISEHFMRGTTTTSADDGSQEDVEFFLDPQTGAITRFGGEGETPELDELLNTFSEALQSGENLSEWMVRRSGEAAVREVMEALRGAQGDAATEVALAEIDEAVAHIEAEESFVALSTAVENLDLAIASAKNTNTGSDVAAALLEAAEHVRDGWVRVRNAISD